MASVNKVILVGNLGRDPEVKMTPTGQKVASFSIATTERYKDQQGNKQEKTEWHNIVAWRKLADIIEQYVKKGSSLYIEGKLTTRSWDDPQGQKKYRTEIIANSIQMLGDRRNQTGEPQGQQPPEADYGLLSSDDPSKDLPF